MSLLFKGRSQGAEFTKVGLYQRLVYLVTSHVRQAVSSLGELWRTPAATALTVAVLGLSITLPSTLYVLVKNAERITAGWQQASEISLFLQQDISSAQTAQLITRLETWPEIDTLVHMPASDALEEFKQLSGFGEALAFLDDNPLPDVLLITPVSRHAGPIAARELLNKLTQQREVDLGKLDIEWLERLYAIVGIAKELVSMIALLLFLSVVLIVGNTIRLDILNKRGEILVMKLVGATDGFIHRPFLYTGFWFGLLGGVVAWIAVTLLLWWMESSLSGVMQLYGNDAQITGFGFGALFTMLLLSIALGLAGSLLSVHRHVREIEPR